MVRFYATDWRSQRGSVFDSRSHASGPSHDQKLAAGMRSRRAVDLYRGTSKWAVKDALGSTSLHVRFNSLLSCLRKHRQAFDARDRYRSPSGCEPIGSAQPVIIIG